MSSDAQGSGSAVAASGSALDALLTAEREIASRLAQGDAEALEIVQAARSRIAARDEAMRAKLASELDAADRAQREASARGEVIAAERDARERRRLDGVSDAELIVLADLALATVLGLGDGVEGRRAP